MSETRTYFEKGGDHAVVVSWNGRVDAVQRELEHLDLIGLPLTEAMSRIDQDGWRFTQQDGAWTVSPSTPEAKALLGKWALK